MRTSTPHWQLDWNLQVVLRDGIGRAFVWMLRLPWTGETIWPSANRIRLGSCRWSWRKLCTHKYSVCVCVEHRNHLYRAIALRYQNDAISLRILASNDKKCKNKLINYSLRKSFEWMTATDIYYTHQSTTLLSLRVYGRQSDQKNSIRNRHRVLMNYKVTLKINLLCMRNFRRTSAAHHLAHLSPHKIYRCNEFEMIWWFCGTYKPITANHYFMIVIPVGPQSTINSS